MENTKDNNDKQESVKDMQDTGLPDAVGSKEMLEALHQNQKIKKADKLKTTS